MTAGIKPLQTVFDGNRPFRPPLFMSHQPAKPPDLILFCPSSFGGIPDYAHHQAKALGRIGLSVLMLCPRDYPHRAEHYLQEKCLPGGGTRPSIKLVRVVKLVAEMLSGYRVLAKRVRQTGVKCVLFATYREYLAPLWAWRLRRLSRRGVQLAAVVHDPVRDFVLGPRWWHRWSISQGYSFLSHAFVHEAIELDTGWPKQCVRTAVIPHGPYPFPQPTETSETVRQRLKIPAEVPLFLSFGHIRNGKNLSLVLQALQRVPQAWLLVVGGEAGTGHTKSAKYQAMAETLGVADRCRWAIGFASADATANYFAAADVVLLTYTKSFRSASGVMNVACEYRRPILASAGEGNLGSSVQRYNLGIRVQPDSAPEIARGMQALINNPPEPKWACYESENSWARNAELVARAMRSVTGS